MSEQTVTSDAAQQFQQVRKARDQLFERYLKALEEGDHENAALWYERFESECARADRMRPY